MDFMQLPVQFDVKPIQEYCEANPQLFDLNPGRRLAKNSPHAQMTDMWIRYAPDKVGTTEHESVWYDEYKEVPLVKQICDILMVAVNGVKLGGVLITKLPPGKQILPHRDSSWHSQEYDKFYIPITRPEDSSYNFKSGTILGSPGDTFWFDNFWTHWVLNNSKQDRLSMIVCIKTDAFTSLKERV
ncbi:aspartyl/asparaginyl beta-hydroxylase [Caudoviricetes sp.]|nr:aspartyl/asparaginyl beta-hydroxylase [Caudoviricetes sp.]